LPGTPIQDVPDWTSTLYLAYRRNLSAQLAFSSRLETNYVGPRTDVTYSTNHLPSYDLTSLRVGIEGARWKAQLFAKNLFDKRAFLDDVPQVNLNIPTFYRIVVSQPRTVGVDLTYRFGR
jgi:outer membrane receptor protein involved in Fe transport